jgi:hypothetical protein
MVYHLILSTAVLSSAGGVVVDEAAHESIENLSIYERFYTDFDISYTRVYRDLSPLPDPFVIVESKDEDRFVQQGNKYHFEHKSIRKGYNGVVTDYEYYTAFDGKTTKISAPGHVNVHEDPVADMYRFRAHNVLCPTPRLVALSEWLIDPAITRRTKNPEYDYSVSFGAREIVEEEDCVKLLVQYRRKKKIRTSYEVWLSVHKSYLPVQMKCFEASTSETHPQYVAVVKEFQELSDGVWFPKFAESKSYDRVLLRKGVLKEKLYESFTLNSLTSTSHPDSFFRTIKTPPQYIEYIFKNGKIIKSQVHADQNTGPLKSGPGLMVAAIACTTIVILYFGIYRRNTRHIKDACSADKPMCII